MADPAEAPRFLAPASLRRAVVRGVVLGGVLAALGGVTGFLLGLVAVPLSLMESWLAGRTRRRGRDASLLLGAWVVALGGLLGAYLQETYTSVLIWQREIDPFAPPGWGQPAPVSRFDYASALEAVRIEAVRVWSPFGAGKAYTRPTRGPLMAACALAFACALGLRLGLRGWALLPLAPTGLLFAYWGWKRDWHMTAFDGLLRLPPYLTLAAICVGLLLALYAAVDWSLVKRV